MININDYTESTKHTKCLKQKTAFIFCTTGDFVATVFDVFASDRKELFPTDSKNVHQNNIFLGKIRKWGKIHNVYKPNGSRIWYFTK